MRGAFSEAPRFERELIYMKKIAIITGASSGIGRKFAETLSTHGKYDELWVIARNAQKLEELKDVVPFPVRAVPMDLGDPKSADEFKALLESENPEISILINCSGYGKFDAVKNLTLEENLGMIDLNCRALTALTCLSLPYMNRGSEIMQIASVAAFQPIPYINVYGATKAFVLNFSRALGSELKKEGIRVLAVCPFWTKTAFFDRAVKADEDAVVKKYVAMYESDFIVKKAWHTLEKTKKDYVVPGFKAKAQVLLVKIMPHSFVMWFWKKQQKLK